MWKNIKRGLLLKRGERGLLLKPTSISAQSFYQTEGEGKLSVPVLLQQIRTDFFARTTNDKSWLILENLEIPEQDVIWIKKLQDSGWSRKTIVETSCLLDASKLHCHRLLKRSLLKNEKMPKFFFLKDFLIIPPLSFGFWRVLAAIFRSSCEKFGCDYAS